MPRGTGSYCVQCSASVPPGCAQRELQGIKLRRLNNILPDVVSAGPCNEKLKLLSHTLRVAGCHFAAAGPITMRVWPVARSIFNAPYVREANERTTGWITGPNNVRLGIVRRAHPPAILNRGIRVEWRVWQRQTRLGNKILSAKQGTYVREQHARI